MEKSARTGNSGSIIASSSFSKGPQLKQRKFTAYRSIVGSIFSFQRGPNDFFSKQRYANTYRLESKKPFNQDKVTNIIKKTLESELSSLKNYDAEICKPLSYEMAQEIRGLVKLQDYDRYRIVVRVNIVEKLKQGVHISSCFLWDPERDFFASYTYENSFIRAVGTVYGVYCE